MNVITQSGSSSILFIGEGAGEPSAPIFSSPAGEGILKIGLLSLGLTSVHLIETRKESTDDILNEDQINSIYRYISDNKISKVLCMGRSTVSSLFPSITSRQSMTRLVEAPLIEVAEVPNIKVGVIYHPLNILKSTDEDAFESWKNNISRLIYNTTEAVNVSVTKIENESQFIALLMKLDATSGKLSLDYETNAVDPFHSGFYITMIGLAICTGPRSADSWYYTLDKHVQLSEVGLSAFTMFLERNCGRIWTYNVTFEMKATWHLTGKYIKMQDGLVLATMYSERSSLKDLVRRKYGVAPWEANVRSFKDASALLIKNSSKSPKEIKDAIINADLETIRTQKGLVEPLNTLQDLCSEDELVEVLSHYPYEWGMIPKDMLGIYCARDAAYTTIYCEEYYTKEMLFAYDIYIRHPWLATKFEVNGAPWDDNAAEDLSNNLAQTLIDLLYAIIKESVCSPQQKLEALDIYNRTLPYDIITYTEKTKQERRQPVKTLADKYNHLCWIFNPNSHTKENRALFWDAYRTTDTDLGCILHTMLETLEIKDKNNLILLDEALGGDRSFLYQNPPSVSMEKIVSLMDDDTILGRALSECISIATDKLEEVNGRFASEVIKFHYAVHSSYLGMKIDDKSTWSREFTMLFNIFYLKKLLKMLNTNVEGNTGRSACSYIKGTLHGKPLRVRDYYLGPEPGVGYDGVVLNTDFNSLSAVTTRWSSGFHTIPAGSPARRCLSAGGNGRVWVHADYSQAELVVLAYFSQDPAMIQAFLDGKDMHKFVASKAFRKPYDEVSSAERRSAKGIGFGIIYGKSVENLAVDMFGGDVARTQQLFNVFFEAFPGIRKWMNQRKMEVDKHGYVTTLFGNRITIDMTEPGGGPHRKAVNSPIQGTASTVAGTSIYNFSEAVEEKGLASNMVGFTHDAMDDITHIDDLFDYLDLMIYKLQDEIFQRTGMPMRIDYEVGVDSFQICHCDYERTESGVTMTLDGESTFISNFCKLFDFSTKYRLANVDILETKTKDYGWADMFTVGTALKDEWGKVITTQSAKLTIEKV